MIKLTDIIQGWNGQEDKRALHRDFHISLNKIHKHWVYGVFLGAEGVGRTMRAKLEIVFQKITYRKVPYIAAVLFIMSSISFIFIIFIFVLSCILTIFIIVKK